jgi:hypothetical protein
MKRVHALDSTIRGGEQTPGVLFTRREAWRASWTFLGGDLRGVERQGATASRRARSKVTWAIQASNLTDLPNRE